MSEVMNVGVMNVGQSIVTSLKPYTAFNSKNTPSELHRYPVDCHCSMAERGSIKGS